MTRRHDGLRRLRRHQQIDEFGHIGQRFERVNPGGKRLAGGLGKGQGA